jgi:hypothetical protein
MPKHDVIDGPWAEPGARERNTRWLLMMCLQLPEKDPVRLEMAEPLMDWLANRPPTSTCGAVGH